MNRLEILLNIAKKETNKDENLILTEALESYLENIIDYKSALDAEKRLLKKTSFVDIETLMKKANLSESDI